MNKNIGFLLMVVLLAGCANVTKWIPVILTM